MADVIDTGTLVNFEGVPQALVWRRLDNMTVWQTRSLQRAVRC
jgi:hypothetical protein